MEHMQFRITDKLSKRIGYRTAGEPSSDIGPFLDWASDHFTFGGRRYIIIVNRASVLTWVIPGKGINSLDDFVQNADLAIRDCLGEYGYSFHYHRFIEQAFDEVDLKKVGDRKMTGIMMDLVRLAKFYLSEYAPDCDELSRRLNKVPQCSRKEPFPLKAFADLAVSSPI